MKGEPMRKYLQTYLEFLVKKSIDITHKSLSRLTKTDFLEAWEYYVIFNNCLEGITKSFTCIAVDDRKDSELRLKYLLNFRSKLKTTLNSLDMLINPLEKMKGG
jgi:hypothetical protein